MKIEQPAGSGRNSRKLKLLTSVCAAVVLGTQQPALALNGPAPVTFDGGALGPLVVSGGLDGYAYGLTGTGKVGGHDLLRSSRNFGAELMNSQISLQKPTGLVRFTLQIGSVNSLSLGTAPAATSVTTFSTGPIYAAYVTLAPSRHVSVSVGRIDSLEGYEAGIDWGNPSVLTTALYNVQNYQSLGVMLNVSKGPVSASVAFGDGFDTGVFNFLQGLVNYNFNSTNSLSVYGATNLSRTGSLAHTYGSAAKPYGQSLVGPGNVQINSSMLGAYYSYTRGNLNLVPEVQFVYAKKDIKAGIRKTTTDFGAALFGNYTFGHGPYSLGGWVEYFAASGFGSNGFGNWFLQPNAKGIGMSITPTWQKGHVFVRGDLGVLHFTNGGDGVIGYGASGKQPNQATFVLEAGLLF